MAQNAIGSAGKMHVARIGHELPRRRFGEQPRQNYVRSVVCEVSAIFAGGYAYRQTRRLVRMMLQCGGINAVFNEALRQPHAIFFADDAKEIEETVKFPLPKGLKSDTKGLKTGPAA